MTAAEVYQSYEVIRSHAERVQVSELSMIMVQIAEASDTTFALHSLAEQYGIAYGTLRRKYYAWKKAGSDLALADKRKLKTSQAENIYYGDFKTYVERDRNTSRGGYDNFLRDLRAGKEFSFGTWRDAFKRDFPYATVPAVCPANYCPKGFSYSNMTELLKKDPARNMALAWNRQGQFAASKYMVSVMRSRQGLPVGAIYEADDVWHNIDVFAPGIKGTFQPLEFAFYDVASAFKVVSAMKPRALVVDPKTGKEVRDNLKEVQFRFALAYLVTCKGFHKDGVTFVLERGTTALRENVQRRVASIPGFGPLFSFTTSGIMNSPAHAGLLTGNAGGNPRMKALCEGSHNILHNATASLLGNRGRDAAHMHESEASVVKYSEKVLDVARGINPDIIPFLSLPILNYDHFQQAFYAIEDEVMDRTNHRLEGWAGNETIEYRLSETSEDWIDAAKLLDMGPEAIAATKAVLATNPSALMRKRKLSRREVWKKGQKDLIRLPLFDMPMFLDPRDVKEATVRADGTIQFTDATYYPGETKIYMAEVRDRSGFPRRLYPGEKVKFFWNPIGELSNQIWIADENFGVVGMCAELKTARWTDPESIKVAMGQKMHQVASLMADTKARHAEEGVTRKALEKVNTFLLEAAQEPEDEPRIETKKNATKISFEDLVNV